MVGESFVASSKQQVVAAGSSQQVLPTTHYVPADGAVDREEAKPREPQPVQVVVDVGDALVGLLGRAVERRLQHDAVRLLEWDLRVEAVDGGRRGVPAAAW